MRKLKIDPFVKESTIVTKNVIIFANRVNLEATSFSKESFMEQVRLTY